MYETIRHEKTCPLCKKEFYPENRVARKVICGDDALCNPTESRSKDSECKVYEFCSEKCAEEYTTKLPECEFVPAWKKLMGKINETSKSNGLAGDRVHNLHKYNK